MFRFSFVSFHLHVLHIFFYLYQQIPIKLCILSLHLPSSFLFTCQGNQTHKQTRRERCMVICLVYDVHAQCLAVKETPMSNYVSSLETTDHKIKRKLLHPKQDSARENNCCHTREDRDKTYKSLYIINTTRNIIHTYVCMCVKRIYYTLL